MRTPLNLSIPDDQWEPLEGLSDPLAGLAGPTLVINGISHHMEAWEVATDSTDEQLPVETWEEEYVNLHHAVHADGGFQTVRIGERDYIIVISPHCS